MDICGDPWRYYLDSEGDLGKSMDILGEPCLFPYIHGYPETSMDVHGYPSTFIDTNRGAWLCMQFQGCPESSGASLISNLPTWTSMGHPWDGYAWASMDIHAEP